MGGNDAGDEDEFTPGYAGSGYCKAGHTGPMCQVCTASDFYFDSAEAMECVQCPKASERLNLPLGIIGFMLGLLLVAVVIKRFALRLCLSLILHLHIYTLRFLLFYTTRRTVPAFNYLRAPCFRIWSEHFRAMATEVKRLVTRFKQLEITPKLKLLFTSAIALHDLPL